MSHRLTAIARGTARRALAFAMALTAIVTIRPAHGDPGDIFTVAAPAVTAAPPTAAAIGDGDASVSSQTGAFTYSYPIAVPPGRNMQPGLSLSYSSQAAIYGGLAAGWSLTGIPLITQDTREGTLSPGKKYTSTLAGGLPLQVVDEPGTGNARYRAQNDNGWVRYERFTNADYWWHAKFPDGSTFYFGDKDAHASSCTNLSDGYAPLTRAVDAFGNQIDYIYESVFSGECRIRAITWGQNIHASVGYFAAIEFNYQTVPPPPCNGVQIGTQTSYRTGVKIVTGASALASIRIAAFPPRAGSVTSSPIPEIRDHTRTINLAYSTTTSSCYAGHAAFRALTQIQETAVGIDSPSVTLPAIDFVYGDATVSYPPPTLRSTPWPPTSSFHRNLGWGYRPKTVGAWPTVEEMMIDIDGDGLIDRIASEPHADPNNPGVRLCGARWYRNKGAESGTGFQFEDAGYIEMPTLKWATNTTGGADKYCGGVRARDNGTTGLEERCSLNYQRTGYLNSQSQSVGPGAVSCHPMGAPCPSAPHPGYCHNYPGGPTVVETNNDCDHTKYASGVDTVFAWRWFDIDGDSLPDLIGSPIKGGLNSYDLQWGNGVGGAFTAPAEPAIFGAFPTCPTAQYSASTNRQADPYTMCGGKFPWMVYLNHGNGVFGIARTGAAQPNTCGSTADHANWGRLPDKILYQPIPLETASGDSSIASLPVGEIQGTVDIDGDGFADAVKRTSSSAWSVYRNDGTGLLVPSATGSPPFIVLRATIVSV